MICRGCEANLGIAKIVLQVSGGRLIVVCPLCRHEQRAFITIDGLVELIGENDGT